MQKNSISDNLNKKFTVHAVDAVPEYQSQHITSDPILTSLREPLGYAVGNLTTAFAVATIIFSGMSPLLATTALVTVKSPSETLQKVPLGFRDEFLRARAESGKNGTNVFRYIQKGNIEGLTDSKENGIGPGHGKSTSALEAAIASESSRAWEQVRIDALARALGNQSFNDFSKSINQEQTKAGLPKFTEFQLRNFMDVSFWRTPEKGEPNMARETGDSEYYQLPKLTPSVRASLITTKLNYQEKIVNEAVAVHNLTGKRLHTKLTGEQDLIEAEAKFVSAHLNAVRFASPTKKTQALLRLGSEPYIQPPAITSGKPPVILIPPEAQRTKSAPPGAPPFIAIPPANFSSTDTPPVALIPPSTAPTTSTPPSTLPGTPPTTSSSTPPWNRPLVLIGAAAIVLVPLLTDGSDGDDSDTPSSDSTPASGGDGSNTPPSDPTLVSGGEGFPNIPPSDPTPVSGGEGFPNMPPSEPTTAGGGDGSNTPPSEPTPVGGGDGSNTPPSEPTTAGGGDGSNTPPSEPTPVGGGDGSNTPPSEPTTAGGGNGSNTPPSDPTIDIPGIITNLPGYGCPTTPASGSTGNTSTGVTNPNGDGCINTPPSDPTINIPGIITNLPGYGCPTTPASGSTGNTSTGVTNPNGDGCINTPPSDPAINIPGIITNLPGYGCPTTPASGSAGNTSTGVTNPNGDGCINTPPSDPAINIPGIITNLPGYGCPTTPASGSTGNTSTGVTNPNGDGCLNTPPSDPTLNIPGFSPEIKSIPEPSSILGLVAVGAGLLAAKFKRLSNKSNKK